ncbi:MAG: tRNA preQ1(34) S-adenosylmethionine ribosyltransferase-isomerase QueA [Gemmataceae bacterium]
MGDAFFDYELPAALIAQVPSAVRDQSRLLVVRREDASLAHHRFHELPGFMRAGDLLVLNDTRVLPARLLGRREKTGGRWEGLFLGTLPDGTWELLTKTRGRLEAGEQVIVEPGGLALTLIGKAEEGHALFRPAEPGTPEELLERHGQVPLPPYIRKGVAGSEDRERYQTVYARRPGAVAAPTAGLHFTPAILQALAEKDVERAYTTLHVGLGTFQPIQEEDFTAHRMHREWGELPAETAKKVIDCKARGNRVVAVGTTTVRVLETVAARGPIRAWSGETELFIRPPYTFGAVDVLVTNFHLPKSTLLLLVSAFAGSELIRRAYQAAIEERYRFYSYGDAMLIL